MYTQGVFKAKIELEFKSSLWINSSKKKFSSEHKNPSIGEWIGNYLATQLYDYGLVMERWVLKFL